MAPVRFGYGSHIEQFRAVQVFGSDGSSGKNRGGTNCGFGKPYFCPLPKRGRFDENGANDEFTFYPLKTRASLLRPLKTTKMTQMAGVTQEKAWFRKRRVCCSMKKRFFCASQYGLRGWHGSSSGFGSWKTIPTVPVPISVPVLWKRFPFRFRFGSCAILKNGLRVAGKVFNKNSFLSALHFVGKRGHS